MVRVSIMNYFSFRSGCIYFEFAPSLLERMFELFRGAAIWCGINGTNCVLVNLRRRHQRIGGDTDKYNTMYTTTIYYISLSKYTYFAAACAPKYW